MLTIQPKYEAALLTIQPTYEAVLLTIQPKYEAVLLTIRPTCRAALLTTEPQHCLHGCSKYVVFKASVVRFKGLIETTQNSREPNFNPKLPEQGAEEGFSNPGLRPKLGSPEPSDGS